MAESSAFFVSKKLNMEMHQKLVAGSRFSNVCGNSVNSRKQRMVSLVIFLYLSGYTIWIDPAGLVDYLSNTPAIGAY